MNLFTALSRVLKFFAQTLWMLRVLVSLWKGAGLGSTEAADIYQLQLRVMKMIFQIWDLHARGVCRGIAKQFGTV